MSCASRGALTHNDWGPRQKPCHTGAHLSSVSPDPVPCKISLLTARCPCNRCSYADADKCFKDSGLTPTTPEGAACSAALATYTTCVDLAVARCEDQAFLGQIAATKASYQLICMGEPEPPVTFPEAKDLACDGPFTEYPACIGCCQRGHNDALQECYHDDGINGKASEPDAGCQTARWGKLATCASDCIAGRPFSPTAPGSTVSDGKLVNITAADGVPPTGFVDITVNFLLGGTAETWDSVVAGDVLVASSVLYGFDANHLHVTAHRQGAAHNVTLTVRVPDSFVPRAPPAAPARRRRSATGDEHHGVAMTISFADPVASFAPEAPHQRGRRSVTSLQALMDVISKDANAPLYALALVSLLKTANAGYFAAATVTMPSGATVQRELARPPLSCPSPAPLLPFRTPSVLRHCNFAEAGILAMAHRCVSRAVSQQGQVDLAAALATTAAPVTTVTSPQATITTTTAATGGNASGSGQTTASPSAAVGTRS